jgi:GNAT superfamily N-acetyltransferase
MNDITSVRGTFRKLWPHEQALFRDHLLRLDKASRAMRFAHGVSDSFIEDYARHMADSGSTVFAYVEDGLVRAAAELKKLGAIWGSEAEAAFSVESAFQERGLGTELMGRVIRAARNRGVNLLYISCLASNAGMQAIARKHEADLRFELGEIVGEIVPEQPNYFSLLAEAVDDRMGFMMAVLDLQRRVGLAA